MRPLLLLLVAAWLVAGCAAPASNPPDSQPPTGQSLPEVTVFRSPT
jgi:hypothetical protein